MAFSQNDSTASQDMGSQIVLTQSQEDIPRFKGRKRRRQEWRDNEDDDEDECDGDSPQAQEAGARPQEDQDQAEEADRYSHSPDQGLLSGHHQSQARPSRLLNSEADQALDCSHEPTCSTAITQTISPTRRLPHHRLTDLDILPDLDDPSDQSYCPTSTAEEKEELEYENSHDRSQSTTPDYEPEGKRIKVTEGAWVKYDIPQDKLPVPPSTHVPFLSTYNKSRFSHLHNNKKQKKSNQSKNMVTDEDIKSSQTQSQVSQIENPDDEMEMKMEMGLDEWMDEDIDELWSQGFSERSERDLRTKEQLSTIVEGDEDEEEDGLGGQIEGQGNSRTWVEEGFFGDGGEAGFTVWRDRY